VFRGEQWLGDQDEEEVYRLLGMPVIPPEMQGAAARLRPLEGRLPKLVETEHLRGDLHTHTTYSEGKSTLKEMVQHATELGYEYIALTDHSSSQRIARGLELDRLEQKIRKWTACVRSGAIASHVPC
jgi:DNA polymerase (family 10)